MLFFIRPFGHWTAGPVALLLAACSTSPGPLTQPVAPARPAAATTWMAANLENADLLYVDDDGNARIDVFTFPQGKAAGEIIDGRLSSDGLCSDRRGDVFVPGYEQTKILEFAHGGTQPIATLAMAGNEFPMGCAVDPLTGNLAVTTDNGDVGVFRHAKNSPTLYYSGVPSTWYCTYDSSGNLFVAGADVSGEFALTELPHGSTTLNLITVPAEVGTHLGIDWDGKYLAIQAAQDFRSTIVLRVTVTGSQATVVSRTKLAGPPNDEGTEFWLADNYAAQPEDGNTGVGIWKYPSGGKAVTNLQSLGSEIFALTVSYGRRKQ
jgi:hypothetical protein